ncbi:related to MNI1 Putative S-adenosylmethionine-dependent methyltransferase of the seven beta-strand family [Cephalotrichum gorgonifer]|uniref:protein-histidine N-methyltransferase n=1 Tax=Cephalotrichum gorgonifer TaxID=2041049 RepID=A0AAE8MNW3_9PEZI|nr:related to MNI1 Putative S-adenosylmethionine-dependent methyltransferase of the seven beta-strand family [Cephalotrichum gorgonifer]
MSFSFSFSGDDIEEQDNGGVEQLNQVGEKTETAAAGSQPAQAGAFPVEGKPQLPVIRHDLDTMLSLLPSKVSYDLLEVKLDDGRTISLPRRELWDVRVQLMAEDDGEEGPTEGLGVRDVKTGVYEGGFKSWESSVDLVKVLASQGYASDGNERPLRVLELGCGTALPSLSLFQSAVSVRSSSATQTSPAPAPAPLSILLADYNPSVLQLVTLPNFVLTWALQVADTEPALKEAFAREDELELTDEVKEAFRRFLPSAGITLDWISGGWSEEFVDAVYAETAQPEPSASAGTLILGAETIYSPFALESFHQTVSKILQRERARNPDRDAEALVGAKRMYFGVGGSLDDYVARARDAGALVEQLREETEGVSRGVVRCKLIAGP